MERYYGVITSIDPSTSTYSEAYAKKTANEFLNKLYKATKVVDSPYTYNPINILSNYSYLNNNGDNSQNRLIDNFYSGGVYAETRTPEGEVAILVDKTTGMSGANITNADELSVAAVARFSDRLYLVVRPPLPNGDPIDGWVRHLCDIRIEHHYPYTVTPEVQEGEEPPEPVTVDHKTVFHLGSNNSNGYAPAVAYEITTTQSKDTLVKLAWCPADTPSSEKELKSHFTQWDICCYSTIIEGIAGARTLAVTNGKSHTADDFDAGGPIGGFVIHKMKNGSYKYGISVFNTDGSPLYTWSDNARPWDEFDSTGEIPRNVNQGGIGRLISKKTVSEDSEETILKMAVLAPIFCPAANDQADTAKWMPQGLYDYSYFDKTGHIYLKKSDDMADSTPVFFADHGVYLLDGGLGGYQLTDRSLPESYAINTSVIERPKSPSWLTGYFRFVAVFDCLDGLSTSGWLNTIEGGSGYDMNYIGTPIINNDSSARFINRANNPVSAWVPYSWGTKEVYKGSYYVAVFKYKYNGNRPGPWAPFVLGDILGDDWAHAQIYSQQLEHTLTGLELPPWGDYNLGMHYGTFGNSEVGRITTTQQDHWYIVFVGPDGTSNSIYIKLYDLETGAQVYNGYILQNTTVFQFMSWQRSQNPPVEAAFRFFLGGYPHNDTSWKTEWYQGQYFSSPWYADWASGAGSDSDITTDVKFAAIADWSGDSLNRVPGTTISAMINDIREHYGYTT